MDSNKLDAILTAQVLLLAGQLRREKEAKGVWSTDDRVGEAARLIARERGRVLRLLGEAG